MTFYYPVPAITNFVDFLMYINYITGSLFGPSLVLAFFIIAFMAMKRFDSEKAFTAAAFISTIFCFFLLLINLTTPNHLLITSVAVIISTFVNRGDSS